PIPTSALSGVFGVVIGDHDGLLALLHECAEVLQCIALVVNFQDLGLFGLLAGLLEERGLDGCRVFEFIDRVPVGLQIEVHGQGFQTTDADGCRIDEDGSAEEELEFTLGVNLFVGEVVDPERIIHSPSRLGAGKVDSAIFAQGCVELIAHLAPGRILFDEHSNVEHGRLFVDSWVQRTGVTKPKVRFVALRLHPGEGGREGGLSPGVDTGDSVVIGVGGGRHCGRRE
ncbi:hypothetical protein DM02DRAFT_690824, partial [Periconia macrospinosa]